MKKSNRVLNRLKNAYKDYPEYPFKLTNDNPQSSDTVPIGQ
jgi:hypothetical protein